ncbi:iron-containing alcohol dehydrogenase [Kibdelosporangium aridum]|uniref:iron-containing alcohol dehydrogenase n=1 Tax=Kibdelosporangium aridum TaxID=2030 RepID=UPI0035E634EC
MAEQKVPALYSCSYLEEGQEELAGPQVVALRKVHPPPSLAKFHTSEVLFGPGALAELGHCALRLGARRPFLVTDPGLIEAGWADEAISYLRLAGIHPVTWDDITPNPKDHEVEAAYECYMEAGSDVILAVGGGSCIDAAKGVAILSGNGAGFLTTGYRSGAQPDPAHGDGALHRGTGADVTQVAVITDTANLVKVAILSRTLVPEISVTDPRLLITMPDELAAATGLDALTHAIESFVSRAHNVLTDNHALHAVRLIAGGALLRSIEQPKLAGPRLAMAQASLEAGMAFSNTILGATHAMSHQVGGMLDAPHGTLNGILLPHVIRFNAEADPARFVPLAAAAGLPTESVPAEEVALEFAEWTRQLADSVGVPRGLSALGVTEQHVSSLARTTLSDANMTTNPRDATASDIEALFYAAL